jgi:hypothetical protein
VKNLKERDTQLNQIAVRILGVLKVYRGQVINDTGANMVASCLVPIEFMRRHRRIYHFIFA